MAVAFFVVPCGCNVSLARKSLTTASEQWRAGARVPA